MLERLLWKVPCVRCERSERTSGSKQSRPPRPLLINGMQARVHDNSESKREGRALDMCARGVKRAVGVWGVWQWGKRFMAMHAALTSQRMPLVRNNAISPQHRPLGIDAKATGGHPLAQDGEVGCGEELA